MSYIRTPEIRAKQSIAMKGNQNLLGYRHTAEAYKKMSAWQKGIPKSIEHRLKISAGMKGKQNALGHKVSPEVRTQLAEKSAKYLENSWLRKDLTSLEIALNKLLTYAGIDFDEQVRFGRYVVDVFDHDNGIAWEADGMFWFHHQDKERETRRDAYLLVQGVRAVVHLTDEDLKFWL